MFNIFGSLFSNEQREEKSSIGAATISIQIPDHLSDEDKQKLIQYHLNKYRISQMTTQEKLDELLLK